MNKNTSHKPIHVRQSFINGEERYFVHVFGELVTVDHSLGVLACQDQKTIATAMDKAVCRVRAFMSAE